VASPATQRAYIDPDEAGHRALACVPGTGAHVERSGSGMTGRGRDNALDHVIVVVFENRSLDNVLGRLYGPGDGKTFEGVLGQDLSNPIPEWAEHGADRKVVPYTVAIDMDSPNPDTGEEHQHTNTQLFNFLNEQNRFKLAGDMTAPYNAPAPGQVPTMDGFVTNYISTLTAERLPADPKAAIPPEQALHIIHNFLAIQFPLLHPSPPVVPPQQSSPPQQSKLSARQP
jgi:hypothetical protein